MTNIFLSRNISKREGPFDRRKPGIETKKDRAGKSIEAHLTRIRSDTFECR